MSQYGPLFRGGEPSEPVPRFGEMDADSLAEVFSRAFERLFEGQPPPSPDPIHPDERRRHWEAKRAAFREAVQESYVDVWTDKWIVGNNTGPVRMLGMVDPRGAERDYVNRDLVPVVRYAVDNPQPPPFVFRRCARDWVDGRGMEPSAVDPETGFVLGAWDYRNLLVMRRRWHMEHGGPVTSPGH